MKNYLSMGFRVNSVALYLLMEQLDMEFEAVFIDHGGDWPETYEYARYFIATGRPVTVQKRAKPNQTKGVTSMWVLIEHDIDRQGCKDLITKAGLEVPPKSGCYFCPFQRIAQWRELRMKHPALFRKVQELEQRNIAARIRNGKKPLSLCNDGRTLDKIINTQPNLWPEMDHPELP